MMLPGLAGTVVYIKSTLIPEFLVCRNPDSEQYSSDERSLALETQRCPSFGKHFVSSSLPRNGMTRSPKPGKLGKGLRIRAFVWPARACGLQESVSDS